LAFVGATYKLYLAKSKVKQKETIIDLIVYLY